jgi:hypothetical protein
MCLVPWVQWYGRPRRIGQQHTFTLVSSIRKIYSVGATVVGVAHDREEQFGFQRRTASIWLLLNVICRLNHAQGVGANHLPLMIISVDLQHT